MPQATRAAAPAATAGIDARTLTEILGLVRARTGVDFSFYRRATVERRIANRMLSVGAPTCAQYVDLLQKAEREAVQLLERLTIKVSAFYRHKHACDRLRKEFLGELAARCGGRPLRIWSAGCATGEEPYTLAMMLEEAGLRGEVLATDIDFAALELARSGIFSARAAEELPAELAERYLQRIHHESADRCQVVQCVRDRVTFAFHDLAGQALPAPGQFDLISCRNVLIYMERELQEQTLGRLRSCLAHDGLLLLGEAEWPGSLIGRSLRVLDARGRIFRAEP